MFLHPLLVGCENTLLVQDDCQFQIMSIVIRLALLEVHINIVFNIKVKILKLMICS